MSSAPAFLSDKSLRCALISAQTEKTALPGLVFLQKTFRSAKSRVGYEICGLGPVLRKAFRLLAIFLFSLIPLTTLVPGGEGS